MNRLILAALTIGVLVVGGNASAAPPQGVHGTGIQRFNVFGFEGSFRLSLSATQTPAGDVVGHTNVLVEGAPGIPFGSIQATPIYFEMLNEQTACVVSNITRLDGWPSTPVRTTTTIVDVPGGPDRFGSSNSFTMAIDPADLCQQGTAPNVITDGNFTIAP
jgi:hypothetical protein